MAAYWHNSPIDVVTMIFANIGVSIPIFVLGLLLAYFFAVVLKGHALCPAAFRPAYGRHARAAHRRGLGHGGV